MKIRLEAEDVEAAIAQWVEASFPGWQVDGIKPIRLKEGGMAAEVELAHDNDE